MDSPRIIAIIAGAVGLMILVPLWVRSIMLRSDQRMREAQIETNLAFMEWYSKGE